MNPPFHTLPFNFPLSKKLKGTFHLGAIIFSHIFFLTNTPGLPPPLLPCKTLPIPEENGILAVLNWTNYFET